MRRSLTLRLFPVLFALVAVLVPVSAWAAEVRQGNAMVVAPGEMIDDDLYVFGGTLSMQGTVDGDVVFFGGTLQTTYAAVVSDAIRRLVDATRTGQSLAT